MVFRHIFNGFKRSILHVGQNARKVLSHAPRALHAISAIAPDVASATRKVGALYGKDVAKTANNIEQAGRYAGVAGLVSHKLAYGDMNPH
jgi:hypothetical protein